MLEEGWKQPIIIQYLGKVTIPKETPYMKSILEWFKIVGNDSKVNKIVNGGLQKFYV